ncbi:XRE family transcriptional regulator [Acidovorax sp. NCPPB 4044]|uniref:XRE family transcriptional regulator n=1 Tax=Acidovorax sp. NCPPB 4044 TaxID=2940490 RepID=UPI002303C9BF|nr:XRE family transcriptional regulator [Acidovorax sp. NCPPB 4044]MDA8522737.1 XRE family transcriptional regulator [Acidovorax sp. NCPPB 4044]
MQDAKQNFAEKLRNAMEKAGYEARPSVLEREFNTRHWGKPMSLHGVRRWLLGETLPDPRKLATLSQWLQVPLQDFIGAAETPVSPRAAEPPGLWHSGMGYDDRKLFDIYLRLPVPQRRTVRDVILAIARAHAADEERRENG